MRLFVAIDLPGEQKKALGPLLEQIPVGRALPSHQLHLTLRFIGEASLEDFENIKDHLQTVSAPCFSLNLNGIGCFPNLKRPRVLWVGIEVTPELKDLKCQIDRALVEVGIEPEERPFRPHLTLGRFKYPPKPGQLDSYLQKYQTFQSGPFSVGNFYLYSSKLSPKGALHTVELEVPLDKNK